MPTVLVVDDEANIRDLLTLYLTAAGFSVLAASDGREALERFRADHPDLVILDIMIPVTPGPEVCAAIRAESDTPVIMLTARSGDMDKVALLEAGADDYVVKPFSPPELVARVRAVMRRVSRNNRVVRDTLGARDAGVDADHGPDTRETAAPPSGDRLNDLRVGGLFLSRATREVRVDGDLVPLTAREFDLLAAMVEAPGVVLSRRRLLEAVTGFDDYFHERGVDVHIRHIREKLGDDANEPRFIETVRGVGYRVRRADS